MLFVLVLCRLLSLLFLDYLFLEVFSMSRDSKHMLFILYHLLYNVGLTPEFESWMYTTELANY
jgi:hypothetical protein